MGHVDFEIPLPVIDRLFCVCARCLGQHHHQLHHHRHGLHSPLPGHSSLGERKGTAAAVGDEHGPPPTGPVPVPPLGWGVVFFMDDDTITGVLLAGVPPARQRQPCRVGRHGLPEGDCAPTYSEVRSALTTFFASVHYPVIGH